jgi:S1-C subfamily serine protease
MSTYRDPDDFGDFTARPFPGVPPGAPLRPEYPPVPPPRVRPVTLVLVLIFGLLAGFALYRFVFDRGTPAVDPRPVTARGDLAADEKATIELFRKASPSVVFITSLGQAMDYRTRNILEVPRGSGSGFIWDNAGHVVTNYHVIREATGAQVTLNEHSNFSAELVGVAPEYDLAVLRIKAEASRLPPIAIGTSHDLQVGQKVFAIGNPFGLDQSLTTGVVSALGRTIQGVAGNEIEEVIQTDAAINPGNSGGPLLDSAGRLIGVNTAIFSPSGSNAGIGFAVPVDTVNRAVPQLIRNGRIVRPRLPVTINEQLSDKLPRERLGVEGVLVLGVDPGSSAEKAGLRGTRRTTSGQIIWGDVIQAIDGKPVRSVTELYRVLETYSAGDTVTLTVFRDGQPVDVKVQLQPGQYQSQVR